MVWEVLKPMNQLNTSFMMNKSTLLNSFCAIFALFCLSTITYSQVEQVTINGETYYVYPLQKEVRSMEQYYYSFADKREVIKRDDRNEKIVSVSEKVLTKQEKAMAFKFTGKYKKFQKQLVEMLYEYPGFLVESDNTLNYDPTPALVQLPAGKYVQYYRDIPYIQNRVVRYKNDVVAGFFELKNNTLNGPSRWFNPIGQLSREGSYLNGEKDGEWKHYILDENNVQNKYNENASFKENLQLLVYDTTLTIQSFKQGIKDGRFELTYNSKTLIKGFYTGNQETGSWEVYNFKKHLVTEKKETLIRTTDTLILTQKYTYRSDSLRGKSIILLHGMVHKDYLYQRNDFDTLDLTNQFSESNNYQNDSYYEGSRNTLNFDSFYSLYRKTHEIELEEEASMSYEGAEYMDENEYGYEGEYFDGKGYEDFNRDEYYKYAGNKQYTLNDFIDSAGYLMLYEGIYERYYQNGQLQFKCEIQQGKLISYSPMYWDNGKIACEVVYLPDSNDYCQNYYDYTGKKYNTVYYDSKGNVKIEKFDFSMKETIDGLDYYINGFLPTLVHVKYDTLYKGVTQPIEIRRELFKVNHQLAATHLFNPNERTLQIHQFNLLGDTVTKQLIQFGENYETIHSSRTDKIGNLALTTISNGSLDAYLKDMKSDTISTQYYVIAWQNNYEKINDNVVMVNDKLFTGKLNIKRQANNFSVKSNDKSVTISLPKITVDNKLYRKQVEVFIKKQKEGSLIPYYTPNFMSSQLLSHAVAHFFPDLYGAFSGMGYYPSYGFNEANPDNNYFMDEYLNYDNSHSLTEIISAEGAYLDGKPTGKWLYKNRKGLVLFELNYSNGQHNGIFNQYEYAYPINEDNEEYYYGNSYQDISDFTSGFPKKMTRYLSTTKFFKNGLEEGTELTFNWKGDTLSYAFYKEGLKEGFSFERNRLFYSTANYQNDRLDGIVKTYLTRSKNDSILLYDLNFQNGFLQGESKAYHTNGRIAKKGFFLMGQPIDDYEAYDTLGFRYQYVKFQYNQPIEEKIWEENELSVKYEFDWRDSIAFNFADITSATSVNTLLDRMGYEDEEMYQPYTGRPSLTDKSGINYHVTKYYPNDTVARFGTISKGKKVGCWQYFNYQGVKLFEVDYFDTLIVVNDSIQFKAKGILSYVDKNNEVLSKSWIIEKIEKYDCAHTDHTEERMLYCFWEKDSSQHRINGYVKNYYENGNVQNEGWVKNGIPTGVWKMYDVNGNLSQVGQYAMGKRHGRWLKGDLGSVKNMSEICLNPNLENLEEILNYQEKLLDISVIIYDMGTVLKQAFYGINMNSGDAPEGYGEEYYEGY